MIVNVVMVSGMISLALAVGACIGILLNIHPLNEDFRRMTFVMMYIAFVGLLVLGLGALLNGR